MAILLLFFCITKTGQYPIHLLLMPEKGIPLDV
jgi:hypothetical protein